MRSVEAKKCHPYQLHGAEKLAIAIIRMKSESTDIEVNWKNYLEHKVNLKYLEGIADSPGYTILELTEDGILQKVLQLKPAKIEFADSKLTKNPLAVPTAEPNPAISQRSGLKRLVEAIVETDWCEEREVMHALYAFCSRQLGAHRACLAQVRRFVTGLKEVARAEWRVLSHYKFNLRNSHPKTRMIRGWFDVIASEHAVSRRERSPISTKDPVVLRYENLMSLPRFAGMREFLYDLLWLKDVCRGAKLDEQAHECHKALFALYLISCDLSMAQKWRQISQLALDSLYNYADRRIQQKDRDSFLDDLQNMYPNYFEHKGRCALSKIHNHPAALSGFTSALVSDDCKCNICLSMREPIARNPADVLCDSVEVVLGGANYRKKLLPLESMPLEDLIPNSAVTQLSLNPLLMPLVSYFYENTQRLPTNANFLLEEVEEQPHLVSGQYHKLVADLVLRDWTIRLDYNLSRVLNLNNLEQSNQARLWLKARQIMLINFIKNCIQVNSALLMLDAEIGSCVNPLYEAIDSLKFCDQLPTSTLTDLLLGVARQVYTTMPSQSSSHLENRVLFEQMMRAIFEVEIPTSQIKEWVFDFNQSVVEELSAVYNPPMNFESTMHLFHLTASIYKNAWQIPENATIGSVINKLAQISLQDCEIQNIFPPSRDLDPEEEASLKARFSSAPILSKSGDYVFIRVS